MGGSWGVPGGILRSRDAPEDMGAHSGVPREGSRSVNKLSKTVIFEILEAKCQYFHGFKHVHFVDSMWPLGAHGVPRGLWGGPRELQRCLWGRPGRSRDEGSRPRRTPGAPPKLKMSGLGYLWFHPMRSERYKYSGFSDFRQNMCFVK